MSLRIAKTCASSALLLLACATTPAVQQPAAATPAATVTTTTVTSVTTPAVPADISGSWSWNGMVGDNPAQGALRLERSGTAWTGTVTQGDMSFPLKSASVEGGNLEFQVDAPDGTYTVKLKLGTDGTMGGTILTPMGMTGTMTAKRN
jgi:ABC-type Fe3+-hydroxamate transport system substrate-binding protein